MSESLENPVQGYQFWKEHVLIAENFMGSDQEYCRRNGLHPGTFSAYKVKLGFSKRKLQRTKAFVKIEPKPSGIVVGTLVAPAAAQKSRLMPDAKWTAEFVLSLMSQK